MFTLVGLAGFFCIVFAYFGLIKGFFRLEGRRYPLLNFVGASLIMASLLNDWNLPAFILEVFWAAISLYGICKYDQKMAKKRQK